MGEPVPSSTVFPLPGLVLVFGGIVSLSEIGDIAVFGQTLQNIADRLFLRLPFFIYQSHRCGDLVLRVAGEPEIEDVSASAESALLFQTAESPFGVKPFKISSTVFRFGFPCSGKRERFVFGGIGSFIGFGSFAVSDIFSDFCYLWLAQPHGRGNLVLGVAGEPEVEDPFVFASHHQCNVVAITILLQLWCLTPASPRPSTHVPGVR